MRCVAKSYKAHIPSKMHSNYCELFMCSKNFIIFSQDHTIFFCDKRMEIKCYFKTT